MKSRILSLTILAVFGLGTFPAQAKPAASATGTSMKANGAIDWTGYGVGKKHNGSIKLKSGTLEMNGKEITGGEFVLDMKTLMTADSAKLQGHLRSADFFDVDKYSEARYKITKITKLPKISADGSTHQLEGELTIKGISHSIKFTAKILNKGTILLASGSAQIPDRTAFDIKYNSKKFFDVKKLGDKLIDDKIDVRFNLSARP